MPEIPILGEASAKPDAGQVALLLTDKILNDFIGTMLSMQAPVTALAATDIINLLCEHVGRLLALIEPEQIRNQILGEVRRNLPGIVNRHVLARSVQPPPMVMPTGPMLPN